MTCIYRELLADKARASHVDAIFGINFPLRLEPTIFDFAGRLSQDYGGGLWLFYALCTGGFYMAPQSARRFKVCSENGFEGDLSADALGITACLYAYSHLSFAGEGAFQEACSQQFHFVRAFALDHLEAAAILAAID